MNRKAKLSIISLGVIFAFASFLIIYDDYTYKTANGLDGTIINFAISNDRPLPQPLKIFAGISSIIGSVFLIASLVEYHFHKRAVKRSALTHSVILYYKSRSLLFEMSAIFISIISVIMDNYTRPLFFEWPILQFAPLIPFIFIGWNLLLETFSPICKIERDIIEQRTIISVIDKLNDFPDDTETTEIEFPYDDLETFK